MFLGAASQRTKNIRLGHGILQLTTTHPAKVVAKVCLRFYGASQGRQRPPPSAVNMWDEYNKWKSENADQAARAIEGGLIGSPETLRHKLRKFESSHIDQVILLNQAGRTSHQDLCDSLELFAREVMPEFHAQVPEHEAWKRKVLARELELEEIDTEQFSARYGETAVQVQPRSGTTR